MCFQTIDYCIIYIGITNYPLYFSGVLHSGGNLYAIVIGFAELATLCIMNYHLWCYYFYLLNSRTVRTVRSKAHISTVLSFVQKVWILE